MNKLFKISKYTLLTALPSVFLLCLLLRHYYPEQSIFDWIYVIALAGFVGISTNTIAIRMLFRPAKPTFFGRQGLIPKNKEKISQKIAAETEKRLLNVNTIMLHIERGRIIEETISSLTKTVEEYLSRETNRKKIAGTILDFYNEYADKLFLWLTQSAEKYLADFISRLVTVDSVWGVIKPKVKMFFESEELRHKASTWIINNLAERTPELSGYVNDVLDRYIEDQVWWKKTALKGAKYISGLEKETISSLIRDFFYSPKTYSQVVRFVEDNLKNIEAYLEQDETRKNIAEIHIWIKDYLIEVTRDRAIPALREKIDGFLSDDASWNSIDRYLLTVLNAIPSRLKSYLHMPSNIEKIRKFIPDIIQKLNIKKIVADNIQSQDTEEFEQMIMKVTGENFAAIEVFGGLLGMLAGVALKKPEFLAALPLAIIMFLCLERILTWIKK